MGHAEATLPVEGGAQEKIQALKDAGVYVTESPAGLGSTMIAAMKEKNML